MAKPAADAVRVIATNRKAKHDFHEPMVDLPLIRRRPGSPVATADEIERDGRVKNLVGNLRPLSPHRNEKKGLVSRAGLEPATL